jgi:hypothetical protein
VTGLSPGVTAFGNTLQVVSVGDPLQVSFTALGNNPPAGAIVTGYVAVEPDFTVAPPEEVVRLKSTPVPVTFAVWRFPCALSLTVSVPLRLPEDLGANVILTLQLEPAASASGQLLDCE